MSLNFNFFYRENLINAIQKIIDINESNIRDIITLINQNFLIYINNSSLTSEEKSKELFLLKKKRELEYFILKINHDIIKKKKLFQ